MKSHLLHGTLATLLLVAACTSEGNAPGSGGSSSGGISGSGGTSSSGGSSGSGGTSASGGTTASGGVSASGGMTASGGVSASGGTTASGGSSGSGGTSASGGSSGSGGVAPGSGGSVTASGGTAAGGRGGSNNAMTGGKGGASTGSGGSAMPGTCQKGMTKGSEVVIMGESFYAFTGEYIRNRLQENARKAGSLGANEQYRSVAVSGQNMNFIATTEWDNATKGGAVKWVIMDGGGIDCIGGSCSACSSTFKTLLGKMATANVQGVIYTRYPEPGNPPGSDKALKSCLDSVMPTMQPVCEGSTSPKCHWVDLRPVWVNGDTTDGLHPTQSGGAHVGDLIWSEMVKQCFAQ